MGKKSSPAPTPAPAAPAATMTPTEPTRPDDGVSARAAARRASEAETARASLLSDGGGNADVDPLSQKKQMAGSASMMG